MRLTDAEILTEIDKLIQDQFHLYKHTTDNPRHKTFLALKAVATELRARQPAAIAGALSHLHNKIVGLDRSKERHGEFSPAALRDVALEVRAKWPTIRHAIEADARRMNGVG